MSRITVLFFALGHAAIEALPMQSPGDCFKEKLISEDESAEIIDLTFFGNDLYGTPDLQLKALLRDSDTDDDMDDVNPEELGSYLEGDILVPRSSVAMRSSLPKQSSRWPQGVVPYRIEGSFTDNEVDVIYRAMEQFHQNTCVRFVPYNNEKDYVVIGNGHSGCWSAVGRMRGIQQVNLHTPACLKRVGTAVHELMHVLGFLHEQNRQERDEFVVINQDNIRESYLKNFKRENRTQAFGVEYDYGSVMHYSQKAFSLNGEKTILPLKQWGNGVKIGQRHGFSDSDVEKLNRMYCNRATENYPSESDPFETNPSESNHEIPPETSPFKALPAESISPWTFSSEAGLDDTPDDTKTDAKLSDSLPNQQILDSPPYQTATLYNFPTFKLHNLLNWKFANSQLN